MPSVIRSNASIFPSGDQSNSSSYPPPPLVSRRSPPPAAFITYTWPPVMTCPPLTRENAMCFPSGDHERSTLSSPPLVSSWRAPPFALTVKICQLPDPRLAKAIVFPFGDHEGAASSIGLPAAPLVVASVTPKKARPARASARRIGRRANDIERRRGRDRRLRAAW